MIKNQLRADKNYFRPPLKTTALPAQGLNPAKALLARFVFSTIALILTLLSPAQQTAPNSAQPIFHAQSSLVLVDVMARDRKSGLPIKTLKKADFKVYDNGHEVTVTTFDSGARLDTRPIALWFVVVCQEQVNATLRSGAFVGKENLFRPGFKDMEKRDRVGVAHWCDNGDVRLDLRPSNNPDTVVAALAEVLKPIPFVAPVDARTGQIAAQAMVRLILLDAHLRNPQPLPVIVFLHADYTAMPLFELNLVTDDILETSGIVFGISDANVKGIRPYSLNQQESIFHYMAGQTGGEYLSVPANQYAQALQDILLQLHFRYEVGFQPASLDGKRHRLKVELTGDARTNYKTARLRYRPEYIPTPPEAERKH